MELVRVSELSLGQVISSQGLDLAPAMIVAMTSTGDRQLQLIDAATGERLEKIYVFDPATLVSVHDITAEEIHRLVWIAHGRTDEPLRAGEGCFGGGWR
jgi:hypothetical protein